MANGQRTEGYCIHCSKYVVREQDGTLLDFGLQGQATCGDFYEPNPQDHQLDDEAEED